MADLGRCWPTVANYCTIVAYNARERLKEEGWKVGLASIYFKDIGGHTIIVFDTTDKGYVYFDLSTTYSFMEVVVKRGESYFTQNGLGIPQFTDKITSVEIAW
jgi:hypothetical protein